MNCANSNANPNTPSLDKAAPTPGDVVSKVPREPPPVTGGISKENDKPGKNHRRVIDAYSRPQQ
jgi:hypothetical protein